MVRTFAALGLLGCSLACSREPASSSCPAGQVPIGSACAQVCTSDLDCSEVDDICDQDVCKACSDCRASPIITSIDGNGTVDGIATHAAHHLRNALVVAGTGLDGAAAWLSGNGGGPVKLALRGSPTATRLEAEMPSDVQVGVQYTLTVVNQAGSYGSSVTVLQGEPGAEGNAGAAGAAGINMVGFQNLEVKTNPAAPNTKIDVLVDAIVMTDGASYLRVNNFAQTVDCGTVGANGLDADNLVASTWYYVYVVAKADGTAAGLISKDPAAPALPTDYSFAKLVSAVRTDPSAHFLKFIQFGRKVSYYTFNVVLANLSYVVWTPVGLAAAVPPNAVGADVEVCLNTNQNQPLQAQVSIDGESSYVSGFTMPGQLQQFVVSLPLPNRQKIWYRVLNTDVALSLAVLAFELPL
jgi:hypothetical protein